MVRKLTRGDNEVIYVLQLRIYMVSLPLSHGIVIITPFVFVLMSNVLRERRACAKADRMRTQKEGERASNDTVGNWLLLDYGPD